MSRPRWGGAIRVESDTLAQGPAARGRTARLGAQGLGAGVDPQRTCVVRRVANREFERRTPASVSDPVPPGFTLAYRITGPEGETCGARGERGSRERKTCRSAARTKRAWRVRGRAPGCVPLESATAARGAGREDLRRVVLKGPGGVSGTEGRGADPKPSQARKGRNRRRPLMYCGQDRGKARGPGPRCDVVRRSPLAAPRARRPGTWRRGAPVLGGACRGRSGDTRFPREHLRRWQW